MSFEEALYCLENCDDMTDCQYPANEPDCHECEALTVACDCIRKIRLIGSAIQERKMMPHKWSDTETVTYIEYLITEGKDD